MISECDVTCLIHSSNRNNRAPHSEAGDTSNSQFKKASVLLFKRAKLKRNQVFFLTAKLQNTDLHLTVTVAVGSLYNNAE